ncbi:MAG: hypothetical protein KDK70_33625 [Myxococcales bacterium]|nr:hypothetical protein [Myxococcales bacterium]
MIIRDELDALPGGQTRGVMRSRILLGVLADDEAERLGIRVTKAELDGTTRWFRRQFDLDARADVEAFLEFAGLDLAELTAQMRTYTNIARVDIHHRAAIEERLPSYVALMGLEAWSGLGPEPGEER